MTKKAQNTAISVVEDNSTVLAIPRAEPPEELTAEEANEWRAVTNRMPSDYFGREHYPVLMQLCRHTVSARKVAQLIQNHISNGNVNVDIYLKLLKQQEVESRSIVALSRTMRLTHQANVPANTSRTPPITVDAPWSSY